MDRELSLSRFTVEGLAHRCSQETERYYRRLSYDEQYCLELFRRAIVHQDQLAWNRIVDQYARQVTAWITKHELFPEADEECEYFVSGAFANMWLAFSRDPQKFAKFSSLSGLMQYLKLCAHSAVREYVERRMEPPGLCILPDGKMSCDNSSDLSSLVDARMKAEHVWQRVLEIVKNDQERTAAEAFLVYDMKPKEIHSRYPGMFESVSQVRRVKDNLMARLRRDEKLRSLADDA